MRFPCPERTNYIPRQRLGYVTPTGDLPNFLSQFGHQIFGGGTQRLEFDLQQVIFTPTDTQLSTRTRATCRIRRNWRYIPAWCRTP